MVENPSSNAGDTGSIPGWGTKIPYATGQLSPHATTAEPVHLNERAHMLWSPHATTRERKPAHHNQREARAPQLEKSLCATSREKPECHNEETVHCNERYHMPQRPDTAKK